MKEEAWIECNPQPASWIYCLIVTVWDTGPSKLCLDVLVTMGKIVMKLEGNFVRSIHVVAIFHKN